VIRKVRRSIEAAAPIVLSCKVSVIPLHAFNTPPTSYRMKRAGLIVFRGAIFARRGAQEIVE
jgi:hypothetical protein